MFESLRGGCNGGASGEVGGIGGYAENLRGSCVGGIAEVLPL